MACNGEGKLENRLGGRTGPFERGDARMIGIQGTGLFQQPPGFLVLAELQRLACRGEELEDVRLRLHQLLGGADDAPELGKQGDRALLPFGRGHQVLKPALVEQGLQLVAQITGAVAGQDRREIEVETLEIREGIVRCREGRRCRARFLPALQVVHPDRTGAGSQPLLEELGGLEVRVHPQHEVAAEERFLAIAVPGQLHRLIEGAEDPLLDVG